MSVPRRIVRRPPVDTAGEWPAHWPEPLRRAHAARGRNGQDAAQPRLASLLPPTGMLGLDAAATLLRDAIATREIMKGLREMGEARGGPAPMAPKDRSQFLSALETLIQAIKKRP